MDKALHTARLLALRLASAIGWGLMAALCLHLLSSPAHAQTAATLDPTIARQVRELTAAASRATVPGTRVEIELGELDPRLKLAPCAQIQPYLPPGMRLWGRARIGLRCVEGATRWNVYLPVTVQVFANSVVATRALAVGATVEAGDLSTAEVDIAAEASPALRDPAAIVGRTLARPLAAGSAVRQNDLRARQWFAAGETVRVRATGKGYTVAGEAFAMSPGIEGQTVRVRTEAGRVLTGTAVGEREVEIPL